ncbi:unnamed protein product [Rotaria sp. Silwood1]|nr:unnamed protein product [Rotaria sp. Silwood1]CAF3364030.1 unnamed protein product [Rotaria sp. Silwood1]CAF3386768.1 unnamed protein product [Rotaria sp. Silwood1]CAF4658161.1 unnamed protein product [Rotaria sp. Silwood1]CAF4675980.1 unnamed protein product [Rotaria sp. Silwood1]
MSHNTTVKFITTTNFISNTIHQFIQLNFSPSVRLTRYLLHITILILFISILAFIGHKHNNLRISIRPYSQFSRLIVSICIISLVLDDLLVINGVTLRIWCSIHQILLHFLLMIIIVSRLLPDFYEYTHQYYHRINSNKLKSIIIFTFIILLCIQLFISIKWLWNNKNYLPNHEWNPPVFCRGYIHPQLFIFILHLFELIFTIQSIYEPIILDDINPMSSITTFIIEKICQLNSILLRLFYFTGTSILPMLFLPGQFSATFYSGILVIEFVLNYLILIYHSNLKYERNINNTNGMIHTGYLRLKNDDLSDDSRLLNDID